MKNLTKLFKLIELTRSQPQTGYIINGIRQNELSNLAEHHYLVTFIAWQLARQLVAKGAKIDIAKVLEFALIHDFGELLGGDINKPYAKINPEARKHAKAFEEENQIFLSKFFDSEAGHYKELSKEILDAHSDECVIAKIADYLELMHFMFYLKNFSNETISGLEEAIRGKIEGIKDEIAKKELNEFMTNWAQDFAKEDVRDILLN